MRRVTVFARVHQRSDDERAWGDLPPEMNFAVEPFEVHAELSAEQIEQRLAVFYDDTPHGDPSVTVFDLELPS